MLDAKKSRGRNRPENTSAKIPLADSADWPLWGLMDDMRPALERGLQRGPVSLVTITGLEGGGPRPVGSQMVVTREDATGFLSGGCIESDVILRARECLDTSEPIQLVYGRGSPWFDIQLLCGARIELLVEPIRPTDRAALRLLELMQSRRPALWITNGVQRHCDEAETRVSVERGWFARRFDPLPRLVIAGSDPISLALAGLGIQAGFETYLLRPQGPPSPPPIRDIRYLRCAPQEALSANFLDHWSYVAVCSHDQDRDVEILQCALRSDAPYVGLLGSRRRLPRLKERLLEVGITQKQLLRLRAPIGLDLGACSQFGIAVSIIGEMISVKNAAA
jgi:xanthine dehydrogenase accessory factor